MMADMCSMANMKVTGLNALEEFKQESPIWKIRAFEIAQLERKIEREPDCHKLIGHLKDEEEFFTDWGMSELADQLSGLINECARMC